jgi:hypothetical protein
VLDGNGVGYPLLVKNALLSMALSAPTRALASRRAAVLTSVESVSKEIQNCRQVVTQIASQRFGVAATDAFHGLAQIADVVRNQKFLLSHQAVRGMTRIFFSSPATSARTWSAPIASAALTSRSRNVIILFVFLE